LFNTADSYSLPVPPAPLMLRHYGALQIIIIIIIIIHVVGYIHSARLAA